MLRWLTTKRVFVAVVFLGIFAMAAHSVGDPDVWWHLKTGELIAQTKSVPRTDSFSFTRAGYPWIAHEWLTELFIYGIYRVGGLGGLLVVFALIVSVAFFLVFLRSAPDPFSSGVIVLWGAWATAPIWGVRPQIISLLVTSLWLLLLERSEQNPRLLWWTLPLTVLWVNLHAGFALGLALLLLFLAGEFLEQASSYSQQNVARLRALAVTFLCDLLLVPLNPNGTKMYLYPLNTLRSKAMQNYIAEWASPNFHHAAYLPFLWLLLATVASLGWSRLRVRPRDIVVLMVSTFAALSAIRMIPFFVLIAVPILSRPMEIWARSEGHGLGRSSFGRSSFGGSSFDRPRQFAWRVPMRYANVLNLLILLSLAGFCGLHITRVIRHQPQAEDQRFPAGAVAYLLSHPTAGPLFNLYDWGGYLIWRLSPRARVFVDGRADLYGESLMLQFADTYDLKGNWQKTLQKWQIRTVLVLPDSALAVALRQTPGWEVRYSDSHAILLERSAPDAQKSR
ncbi:MAG TPA: hypothetical protein VKR60_03215 [Candidatus Sulfotelmatobacter sp.]|nr:hypothetical protein [Candidatus Sulfotelmatobacter sp.]